MLKTLRIAGAWAMVAMLWPGLAVAQEDGLPLWELGLGAAGISLPAYPGSDEQQFFGAPFPYVVYRGRVLRADDDGVRGLFFSSEGVRLEVSGN
ncbi:MAG: MipA/OmpV family protein, partial [Algiphilus sp.]